MSEVCDIAFLFSSDLCLSKVLRRGFGQSECVGWHVDPVFNEIPLVFWQKFAELSGAQVYRSDRAFPDIEIYLDTFIKAIDVLAKKQRYNIRLLASALDVVFIHEFLHFVGLKDESEVSNAVRCFTLGGVNSSV